LLKHRKNYNNLLQVLLIYYSKSNQITVKQEVEMFALASKSRQRKCVGSEMVTESKTTETRLHQFARSFLYNATAGGALW